MSTKRPASDPAQTGHEQCIFCRIASGEIPSHTVYEDDSLKAFLDIRPIRPGHVLIITKQHYEYYDDMPPDLAAAVVQLGQRLGKAMKRHYGVERAGFMFTGTDVAHVHAHVLPLHEKHDLTSTIYIEQENLSFRLAPQRDHEELGQTALDIKSALKTAGEQ